MTFFKLGETRLKTEKELVSAHDVAVQMRKFGHAVHLSAKYDDRGKFVEGGLMHFLTCKTCAEETGEREREKHGR